MILQNGRGALYTSSSNSRDGLFARDNKPQDQVSREDDLYGVRAIDSLKVLFAPFLPFTSEKLHQLLSYEAPLFGEQYIEQVEDSLGTHNVYVSPPRAERSGARAPRSRSVEAQQARAESEASRARPVVQEVGGKCGGRGTGEVREVKIIGLNFQ